MHQVDQGQHELREPILELVGFQIDAPRALGLWRIAGQGLAKSAVQRPRRRFVKRFIGRPAAALIIACRLDRADHDLETEVNQIDIGDRNSDLARDHGTLVQDAVEGLA